MAFSSGLENCHCISPVTRVATGSGGGGSGDKIGRFAFTMWFTLDPQRRESSESAAVVADVVSPARSLGTPADHRAEEQGAVAGEGVSVVGAARL